MADTESPRLALTNYKIELLVEKYIHAILEHNSTYCTRLCQGSHAALLPDYLKKGTCKH